jgi:hypothetical protein
MKTRLKKYTCYDCGCKFYDYPEDMDYLCKDEIVCEDCREEREGEDDEIMKIIKEVMEKLKVQNKKNETTKH